MRAGARVVVAEERARPVEDDYPALLEPLAELGRDPWLPARERGAQVGRAVVGLDAREDRARRRRVEERRRDTRLEAERVVAAVRRVGEERVRREADVVAELQRLRGRADADADERDVARGERREHVARDLRGELLAEESPERAEERDDRALVVAPERRDRHRRAIGRAQNLEPRECRVLLLRRRRARRRRERGAARRERDRPPRGGRERACAARQREGHHRAQTETHCRRLRDY